MGQPLPKVFGIGLPAFPREIQQQGHPRAFLLVPISEWVQPPRPSVGRVDPRDVLVDEKLSLSQWDPGGIPRFPPGLVSSGMSSKRVVACSHLGMTATSMCFKGGGEIQGVSWWTRVNGIWEGSHVSLQDSFLQHCSGWGCPQTTRNSSAIPTSRVPIHEGHSSGFRRRKIPEG